MVIFNNDARTPIVVGKLDGLFELFCYLSYMMGGYNHRHVFGVAADKPGAITMRSFYPDHKRADEFNGLLPVHQAALVSSLEASKPIMSDNSQTRVVTPAAIAGVHLSVWWILQKL